MDSGGNIYTVLGDSVKTWPLKILVPHDVVGWRDDGFILATAKGSEGKSECLQIDSVWDKFGDVN